MKKPLPRNSPLSPNRRQAWLVSFQGYRHVIDDGAIQNWLGQFEENHRDIGARVLDSVEFIRPEEIDAAYRTLLASLPGWHSSEARRHGTWKFVPFTSSAGESGDMMIAKFRGTNNMSGKQYKHLFAYRSELASLGKDDTVVFIDDFSGSGSQVEEYWPMLDEILAGRPTAYLMLVAATSRARQVISDTTSLHLHASRFLDASDDIFSTASRHFSQAEKDVLETYCWKADKKAPKGYGECGLLLVLAHKAPNNTIPVLHKTNTRWTGLFRRYN